jgi:hypothetical protein
MSRLPSTRTGFSALSAAVSRESERGWRAYLTSDEDGPAEAVIYCEPCAERQFGADA